jgi:hypothetical protein
MQRFNRSAHTPLGTAFFLFVGLAIIPVSLKAAGLQVGFSPRLSAAIDIWRQVAQTFGPNYEAGSSSDLAALISSDAAPSQAAEDEGCPLRQYACDREIEESSGTLSKTPAAFIPAVNGQAATCSYAAPRNRSRARRLESSVAGVRISSDIENSVRSLKALSAERAEAALRVEVLKVLEKCAVSRRSGFSDPIKNLGIPRNFRMLVRFKQSAATSVTGAECKARAALAPAGRLKLERASLTSTPAPPDNCDL